MEAIRCPSADEWIRKLWYIYTMEYYSAIKKNPFVIQDVWGWRTGMTQRDGMGTEVGGGVQDVEHMYTHG